MSTLAFAFDDNVDGAALEILFAAVVRTLVLSGTPPVELGEVAVARADDLLDVRRWQKRGQPPLTLELIDDRSIPLVWAAVEGEDLAEVRAVDTRLRALLPAIEAAQALDEARVDPGRARLLHRAALAHAGRGPVPEALRDLVRAAVTSGDRDRVFAACVAAAQLHDAGIDEALRAAADADPSLRGIVDASAR